MAPIERKKSSESFATDVTTLNLLKSSIVFNDFEEQICRIARSYFFGNTWSPCVRNWLRM